MKVIPATIYDLYLNLDSLRTIANEWLLPQLHFLPPSSTRREAINSLEDISGFLTDLAEVLPKSNRSEKHISLKEHLTRYASGKPGEYYKVFSDRSRQRAANTKEGWKIPVIKEEWLFLKEFFLIAAAPATYFISYEHFQKDLAAKELEETKNLASQILMTWDFAEEILCAAAGVRRIDHEEE
jgi:hypothetical protein